MPACSPVAPVLLELRLDLFALAFCERFALALLFALLLPFWLNSDPALVFQPSRPLLEARTQEAQSGPKYVRI